MICFLVVVNYLETLFALLLSDFILYDGVVIPYTPISWLVGQYCEYNVQMLAVICIISVAIKTCVYNKLACAYLGINLYEKSFFMEHVYNNDVYNAICIANIIIASWITYKGIKIFLKKVN